MQFCTLAKQSQLGFEILESRNRKRDLWTMFFLWLEAVAIFNLFSNSGCSELVGWPGAWGWQLSGRRRPTPHLITSHPTTSIISILTVMMMAMVMMMVMVIVIAFITRSLLGMSQVLQNISQSVLTDWLKSSTSLRKRLLTLKIKRNSS